MDCLRKEELKNLFKRIYMLYKGKSMLLTSALIFITAALLFTGCSKGKESDTNKISYQKITQEEAKKRMESGDTIVILDVRTQEEFDESHIPNSVLIPNETIGKETLETLPDLDAEILIYCRSGNRSKQAAEKMIQAGYTKVYDFGGINDWEYEIER